MLFFSELKLDDSICVLLKLKRNSTLMLQVFLQSVPAWVRAWRGGWWGQRDSGRGLHRVIHGQNQAGAPNCHFVFCQGELVIQTFVGWPTPSGGALAVDGVGSRSVRADGDVSEHGAHVGVIQDEVRIIVMELTFILDKEEEHNVRSKEYKLRRRDFLVLSGCVSKPRRPAGW